jgi:hypothetical protein
MIFYIATWSEPCGLETTSVLVQVSLTFSNFIKLVTISILVFEKLAQSLMFFELH